MTVLLNEYSLRTASLMLRKCVLLMATVPCLLGVLPITAQSTASIHEQAEEFRQAGLSQAGSGHIDEAIASFEKGLVLEPANAQLLDAAGAAYSLKGELETARRYFVESLHSDPESVSTRQNLAIVLFSLNQYEDAARQFAALQDLPGKTRAVASLFLGLIAQRRSDCPKAAPLIEASGDLLYQYPDALLSYSECEYELGQATRAREALAAFNKLPGSTPQQSRRAAALYARLGLSQPAQRERGRAQSQTNEGPDSVLKRAAVLEKSNRLEEAQKLLQDEAAARPAFDVLYELAEVAKQRGDFAVAMKSLKQASDLAPDREDSYLEFSTICADHGNDQLALDSAEIGLEHLPGSYRLTVQKGVVEEKLGHFNDAEETLRKALALQADNSIALVSLAVVQAHAGRPDVAEDTLATAIRQFPDNYYMYYFQGKLLLQVGNTQAGVAARRAAARRALEKAIELNPTYADSYYQVSQVYVETSPKLAEQSLRRCLQLDPTHIPAQYALARLLVRTGRRAQGEAMFARLKGQQRSEEKQQQKQLRIEVAQD